MEERGSKWASEWVSEWVGDKDSMSLMSEWVSDKDSKSLMGWIKSVRKKEKFEERRKL